LRHHELRQGILGKLVQDVTVGTLCCRKIASLELLRGLPGHRAQLLIPIADLQVRIVTGSNSEQFIDHELGLAALYLNPLDRPCEQVRLGLIVNAVG